MFKPSTSNRIEWQQVNSIYKSFIQNYLVLMQLSCITENINSVMTVKHANKIKNFLANFFLKKLLNLKEATEKCFFSNPCTFPA